MILEAFLISLAANYASNLSLGSIRKALEAVSRKRPDLANRSVSAEASGDSVEIERVFREAVGVIIAEAKTGAIEIDEGTLAALRGIRFDHQHGRVSVAGSELHAPILITGGGVEASGETRIGDATTLSSRGTKIEIGRGASIVMTGSASIKQT